MTTPESESSPALNPLTGAVIAGLGLLVFAFFVISGQPLGLSIGAVLSFLVIATVALVVVEREQIVTESYDSTVPELAIRSAAAVAKLPNKLTPACPTCKSEIALTNKFCPECGHKLTAADFAPPSP